MGEASGDKPPLSLKDRFQKLLNKKPSETQVESISETLSKIGNATKQLEFISESGDLSRETVEQQLERIRKKDDAERSDKEISLEDRLKKISDKMNTSHNLELLKLLNLQHRDLTFQLLEERRKRHSSTSEK